MVLSLCRQFCPDKLPPNIGDRLGDGADGEVLNLINEPDKVIKLSILYEDDISKHYYTQIVPVLDFLITNPIDICARVYAHTYLGTFNRVRYADQQRFILYSYTMEKLEKISNNENRVFHTILCHEDRGIVKNYSVEKVREILKGLSHGLDFDEKRIIFFYENLKKSPLNHNDMHVRNIMKNKEGDYRLIDFDRSQLNGE